MFREKLQQFATYKTGWCFHRGELFSESVLANALKIGSEMEIRGWKPEVYPGEEGDILVTGAIQRESIEVLVLDNGNCVYRDKSTGYYLDGENEIPFEETIEKIKNHGNL